MCFFWLVSLAGMDFSELCKVSGSQAEFSPDGRYLARVGVSQKIHLQLADSLKLIHVFTCAEDVQVRQPEKVLHTIIASISRTFVRADFSRSLRNFTTFKLRIQSGDLL